MKNPTHILEVRNVVQVLVLGCGDVGFAVASELRRLGKEPVIVDKDERNVEQLRLLNFRALAGDFGSPEVLREAGIAGAEAVVVLAGEFAETKRALEAVKQAEKEIGIPPFVLVLVTDEVEVTEAGRLGARAVASNQTVTRVIMEQLWEVREMVKEGQLRGLLEGLRGRLAIVLRNDPSLDDLASGIAFKRYAKAFGLAADIVCRWEEFKWPEAVLVDSLNLRLKPAGMGFPEEEARFKEYSGHALIGVATHVGCTLPREILPTIVIDRHPVPASEVEARFCDIRLVGATSTLLTGYLKHAAIELDEPTATALAAGILDGTAVFTREAVEQDVEALTWLLPKVNMPLLRKLLFAETKQLKWRETSGFAGDK